VLVKLAGMTDDQTQAWPAVRYSAQVAMSICDRLAEGKSLRAICSEAGMPGAGSSPNRPAVKPAGLR
jgi:hypothetical protein